MAELGSGRLESVSVADLGDLANVVSRVELPLAQLVIRDVVALDQVPRDRSAMISVLRAVVTDLAPR